MDHSRKKRKNKKKNRGRPQPARPASDGTPAGASDPGGGPQEPADVQAERPRPPTSVRESLGAARPPQTEEAPETSRTFEDSEGARWIARLAGESRSTVTGTKGPPLMLVRFSPEADGKSPVRETLCVRRDFQGLYEEELREMLDRSAPARSRPARPAGERGSRRSGPRGAH